MSKSLLGGNIFVLSIVTCFVQSQIHENMPNFGCFKHKASDHSPLPATDGNARSAEIQLVEWYSLPAEQVNDNYNNSIFDTCNCFGLV